MDWICSRKQIKTGACHNTVILRCKTIYAILNSLSLPLVIFSQYYAFLLLQEKFDLKCVSSSAINELLRGIRSQMSSLISGRDKLVTSLLPLFLFTILVLYKMWPGLWLDAIVLFLLSLVLCLPEIVARRIHLYHSSDFEDKSLCWWVASCCLPRQLFFYFDLFRIWTHNSFPASLHLPWVTVKVLSLPLRISILLNAEK